MSGRMSMSMSMRTRMRMSMSIRSKSTSYRLYGYNLISTNADMNKS
jgi:hypothetical protein